MADELNKSAEFVGKHQDEENPILVAQRYLNIYRQIHIFNQKRRDEFDDSLLKMPSDIRILLSTLPGGSLLLEHISELEEKRGIIPSDLIADKVEKSNTPDEKSFLTAKSSAKNAESVALSNNLIKILQQNEEKHAKDLQALTDAFLKSQENMTAILKQALGTKATEEPVHQVSPSSQSKPEKAQPKPEKAQPKPEKPQPKQEDIPQKDHQEEQKSMPEETPATDTASKILNFTKKLFTSNKEEEAEESEQTPIPAQSSQPSVPKSKETHVSMPAVDQTPVSLDDIDAAPVSLDAADASFSSELTTLQNDPNSPSVAEESTNGWEWEYVDDEGSPDDEEWEYIADETEDPQDDQWEYVADETENQQDGQWEYVEDLNGSDPNAEYAYEYTDSNADGDWVYTEENTDGSTDQNEYYPSSPSQPEN